MILFVDETENNDYFIVCGLLVNSQKDIETAYKHFKHRISNVKLKPKIKGKIYREFKSFDLDKSYQSIKKQLLLSISTIPDVHIFYSYVKKSKPFDHLIKKHFYITLLMNIIKAIPNNIYVYYDSFNNSSFEERINSAIGKESNVVHISSKDSQKEHGIQFVDNICGTIRLKLSNLDVYNYYIQIDKITNMV